jgi:hypothetical protein
VPVDTEHAWSLRVPGSFFVTYSFSDAQITVNERIGLMSSFGKQPWNLNLDNR